ncbi:conserved hypothetical protein [Agrobacterium fabacearum TT111]|nr:conserved hypothetical protein [Agrobacterium fabacearum TT111]
MRSAINFTQKNKMQTGLTLARFPDISNVMQ